MALMVRRRLMQQGRRNTRRWQPPKQCGWGAGRMAVYGHGASKMARHGYGWAAGGGQWLFLRVRRWPGPPPRCAPRPCGQGAGKMAGCRQDCRVYGLFGQEPHGVY